MVAPANSFCDANSNSKSAPHISPGADRGANSSKMIKSTPIEFQSEIKLFAKGVSYWQLAKNFLMF